MFSKTLLMLLTLFLLTETKAQTLRERIKERIAIQREINRTQTDQEKIDYHIQKLSNIEYGNLEKQKMDVYIPTINTDIRKPIIFMVHGGGWKNGDKTNDNVVNNKVKYWCKKGYIFISVNYEMLPNLSVEEQSYEIASALSFVQKNANNWNGNQNNITLMGHSAGAHLVTLIMSSQQILKAYHIHPVSSIISLDSAAVDVEDVMNHSHFPLYDEAFGNDMNYWRKLSPIENVSDTIYKTPFLLVCSTQRALSCTETKKFTGKLKNYNIESFMLPVNYSHKEINELLGQNNQYTKDVDSFIEAHLIK